MEKSTLIQIARQLSISDITDLIRIAMIEHSMDVLCQEYANDEGRKFAVVAISVSQEDDNYRELIRVIEKFQNKPEFIVDYVERKGE